MSSQDILEERALNIASHIIRTGNTVRETASVFKVSKSTVHRDMTVKLRVIDPMKYTQVRGILNKNLAERHIRGGVATKIKFRKEKEENDEN